ncbi:MAG: hypothetical protein ACT4ON_01485 [Bacteroidota bacterium]
MITGVLIASRIKAGSLFYAIVISIIIAIVSSSLILFAYLSNIEFQNFEIQQRLNVNAGSGLNLLMSQQSLVELNKQKNLDLYNTGEDSVLLIRRSWGAYEVVVSKATFKNFHVIQIAQVGYYPDSNNLYSLYLVDQDKPLALCGKTKIKGTAFLPKAGVKRAYIEGQNFTGAVMIEGQTKQSEKTLPKFNKALIENLQSLLLKKIISEKDSVIIIEKDLSGDSLINSFMDTPLVLTSTNAIKISDGIYSGHIVIVSDKQITVSASAVIKDVILAAPKIIIEKEFKGNLQAFASDSIIVNKDVSLYYPSVLGIIKENKLPNVSAVVLNENDTLLGTIFSIKNELDILKQAGVIIKEKAFVAGQVYSNGYADIRGTINGSLICNKIILSTPSSVYENHLLNAVIDQSVLSKHYTGINLVEESIIKKVVKWLN